MRVSRRDFTLSRELGPVAEARNVKIEDRGLWMMGGRCWCKRILWVAECFMRVCTGRMVSRECKLSSAGKTTEGLCQGMSGLQTACGKSTV